jgi:hypothetical protein
MSELIIFVSVMFNNFAHHLQEPIQDTLIPVVIAILMRDHPFSQPALTVFWKGFRSNRGVELLQFELGSEQKQSGG